MDFYKPVASIRDKCCVEIEGVRCDRTVYNKSQQLCNAHNLQRLRGQEYKSVRIRKLIREYMSDDCSVEGCEHPAQSRDMCSAHYWQLMKKGKVTALYEGRRPNGATLERDNEGRKLCSNCRQWLDEGEFGGSSRTLDGLRMECRTCRATDIRLKNQNKPLSEKRESWLRRRYGKTPKWFDETLAVQGNACACCGNSEPGKKGWQIDHDHSCCDVPQGRKICGKCIRGIVCSRCNLAFGVVNDSPELLDKMKNYLKANLTHG